MALLASSSLASGVRAAQAPRALLLRAAPRPARPAGRALTPAIAATAKTEAPVKIMIQGRRLPVTPAIKEYVEAKISRAVANYAGNLKRIDVTLSARGGDTGTHGAKQQKVDVTLWTLRDGPVRVEDTEASLYASIDLVADKVSRKMRKVKERAIAKGTWTGRAGPRVDVGEEDFQAWMESAQIEVKAFDEEQARAAELAHLTRGPSPGAVPATVLRSKVLRVDRMPVDVAIDSMEAVGHSFFMFRDEASGEVQLVYKRASGGYGMLIPEHGSA